METKTSNKQTQTALLLDHWCGLDSTKLYIPDDIDPVKSKIFKNFIIKKVREIKKNGTYIRMTKIDDGYVIIKAKRVTKLGLPYVKAKLITKNIEAVEYNGNDIDHDIRLIRKNTVILEKDDEKIYSVIGHKYESMFDVLMAFINISETPLRTKVFTKDVIKKIVTAIEQ